MPPDHPDMGPVMAAQGFGERAEEHADDRSRMSFLEHLDELRRRIIYSLWAIAACCALTFYYWDTLFRFLVGYFRSLGGHLIYSQPAGAFMFSLKVGLLAALLLAAPFVFAQFWLFVAPGLYAKEKKVVIPFVFFASILFFLGTWFGHRMAFPAMWKFFASYEIDGLQFFPTIDDTFSFYMKILLGLGLVFQMPMVVFFLARFGIVTAKFLLKQFRYAVLIIFIIAAVVTPSPDVATQLVFATPMLALYAVSILVAWVFGKRKKKGGERD